MNSTLLFNCAFGLFGAAAQHFETTITACYKNQNVCNSRCNQIMLPLDKTFCWACVILLNGTRKLLDFLVLRLASIDVNPGKVNRKLINRFMNK